MNLNAPARHRMLVATCAAAVLVIGIINVSSAKDNPGERDGEHEGFAYATRIGAQGVMVLQQADLNFNNEQHLSDAHSYDAFADYINALRTGTLAFDPQ
jgi:hypothetical protein